MPCGTKKDGKGGVPGWETFKSIPLKIIKKYKESGFNDFLSDYIANIATNKREYNMMAEMYRRRANKLRIKRENPGIPENILEKESSK